MDKTETVSAKSEELEVNIDFDLASREWRKNKKSYGDGAFRYVCGYTRSNGKPCKKKPKRGTIYGYCSYHKKLIYSPS